MALWSWQRLNAQFVLFLSILFLVLISQVYAQAQVLTKGVQSGSGTAESEKSLGVASTSDFRPVPPHPRVRSEIPYFAGSPLEPQAPDYEMIRESRIHEPSFSGSNPVVAEEDGIPLMAETVVEGRFVDSFNGTDETHLSAQLQEESVREEGFVDPFEEAVEKQVTEESRDPWESFNSSMFDFNYKVDRYVMKPVAKGYNFIIPPDVQNSLGNAFSNMAFAPRFLNNVFQGKFKRAGAETQRFLINTTIGIGGLFDVAKYVFDIETPATEDVGQTLAVSGIKSGPYLVLPFLPPTTVRDAIGFVGDTFLNPLNYFIPFIPNLALNVEQRVNERSINLETFEGLEESTVDLYGAVRSAYFERRAQQIRE